MEFILPLGTVKVGDRVLTNVRASISDKYLFLIGVGPDGTYEERLLEINSEDAVRIISENVEYVRSILDRLDKLLLGISSELGVNIVLRSFEGRDAVGYTLSRLTAHDEYLKAIGDGWRRVLDGARIGKVNRSLMGLDRIYVIYSGNNITLNLVAEPVEGGSVEVITYTEGKATGIVRVRVGEDVVVKTDIRSPSSLIILSQTRNPEELSPAIADVAVRVRAHVIDCVNDLLSTMRRYGAV